MSALRVVVIEDDPPLHRYLRRVLGDAGYDVYSAETAQRGLAEASARRPDLILLDLGLPDGDGLQVLTLLRQWFSTPVIVLSARGDEATKVRALDSGADDFLVKPFGNDELLARLRVAQRHLLRGVGKEGVFELGDVIIDLATRKIMARGVPVHLTATEFKLLCELVTAGGRVLTHGQLLTAVWGPTHSTDTHYLRLFMAQLRAKLEADPTNPQLFLTEQGVGYRIAVD
jgi:two-component system KDP operon response regulator KdpE